MTRLQRALLAIRFIEDHHGESEASRTVREALREAEGRAQELRAGMVLDAWATKHGCNVPQVQRDLRPEQWTVFVSIGDERVCCSGPTPAIARFSAAAALASEDTELLDLLIG